MKRKPPYPTHDGIPVPFTELDLPKSELDLSDPENFNKHHRCFTAKKFGRYFIYRTLRDLESLQDDIPSDVHTYLHNTYREPSLPTPDQALSEIMRAAEANENLNYKINVKNTDVNLYVSRQISEAVLRRVLKNYNQIKSWGDKK